MTSTARYDDDGLAVAIAASRSWRGVLRHLGLKANCAGAARSVRRRADLLGLDYSHFTGQRRWTEDELAMAVASSRSWTQVTATLGLSGGSSTTALKGHAARLGIESGHLARRSARLPPGSAPMRADLTKLPRAGSMLAAAWFVLCGYEVAWPLEPCRYDLVASMDDEFLRVQVKTTRVRQGASWIASLSTNGGRLTYDPDDIDYFFVIDGDLEYYLLPVAAVGGLHAISLSAYQQFRLERQPVATS